MPKIKKIFSKLLRKPKGDIPTKSIEFHKLVGVLSAIRGEAADLSLKYCCNSQGEYIDRLIKFRNEFKDGYLKDNIDIKLVSPDSLEHTVSFTTKYFIVIKNLNIIVDRSKGLVLYLSNIPQVPVPGSSGGLFFIFNNNTFEPAAGHNPMEISISLRDEVGVSLYDNNFINTNLAFSILEWTELKDGYMPMVEFFGLESRKHLSPKESIEVSENNSPIASNWHVPPRTVLSYKFSNSLTSTVKRFVAIDNTTQNSKQQKPKDILSSIDSTKDGDADKFNKKQHEVRLKPEDVIRSNRTNILLKDNKVNKVKADFPICISFEGRNIIGNVCKGNSSMNDPSFDFNDSKNDCGFDIYWGPYNEIDREGEYARSNSIFFLYLRDKAIKSQDKSQEAIINRELIKCNHHLINNESKSTSLKSLLFGNNSMRAHYLSTMQDRLIMWFGKTFTDHGVSLLRPVLSILGFNALCSLILISLYSNNLSNWIMFFAISIPVFSIYLTRNILYILSASLFSSSLFMFLCYDYIFGWTGLFTILVSFLNPLGNVTDYMNRVLAMYMLSTEAGWKFTAVSFIIITQKLWLALMTYLLIRVGRRFLIR